MSLKSTFLGKMGTELKYKITNDNQSRSQVKLDIKPNTCFPGIFTYKLYPGAAVQSVLLVDLQFCLSHFVIYSRDVWESVVITCKQKYC